MYACRNLLFDVCLEHIRTLLADDEDFSIAIQCAIIVFDNAPPSVSDNNSSYVMRMLRRHHRLLHDLELIFSQSDPADADQARLLHGGAYNHALSHLSLDLQCSSSWHMLPRPNSRWISCMTEENQEVHHDLLTGQL